MLLLLWLSAVCCLFTAQGQSSSPRKTISDEKVYLVRGLDGKPSADLIEAEIKFTPDHSLQIHFNVKNKYSNTTGLELFVAGENKDITRIELTPGVKKCKLQLYSAPHVPEKSGVQELDNCLNDNRQKSERNTRDNDVDVDSDDLRWEGRAEVGSSLLPQHLKSYNMAATQTTTNNQTSPHILALYTLVNFPISIPDLMVLDKYKVFGAKY